MTIVVDLGLVPADATLYEVTELHHHFRRYQDPNSTVVYEDRRVPIGPNDSRKLSAWPFRRPAR